MLVWSLTSGAESIQKASADCRYLVDGLNPMDIGTMPDGAQMVLVTSPDPRIYKVRHAGILFKVGRAEMLARMSGYT
jgi:hypothetical protein